MANWNNQPITTVLDGVTLTASYNDNNQILDAGSYNLLTVYIEYTPQEASSYAQIQFEAGFDASNLFLVNALVDDSDGVSTVKTHTFKIESSGAGTAIKKRLGVCLADKKLRISANESFSSSAGTLTLTIIRNEQ